MAVNAFSPPESNVIFWSFFPGGWTVISIPHSKIFSSSVKVTSAIPPPNNSLNTSPKFLFIISNFSLNCCFIVSVISCITFLNFDIVSSKSNLCSHIKSYLSFNFLYSSIESTFTLPSSFISVLKTFTLLCVTATFSGFWYSPALFGVSSYSSHILFITSVISSSVLVFFTSIFVIWAFNSSILLNCSVCSSSFLLNFSFFSILSFFILSMFSPLFETLDFTFSISCFVFSISIFSLSFSKIAFFICKLLLFLFLVCVSISFIIISVISWIETSLSLKDETDIFKFVMSKFKSSMYFWLSLFAFENSSIIFWSSSFCLLIFSMHSLFFCLLANVSFLLFSVFSTYSILNLFYIFINWYNSLFFCCICNIYFL